MKRFLLLVGIFLLLLALLINPQRATAQPALSTALDGVTCEKFVAGGNYTLEKDDVLQGNLCILGGSALIEAGATVDGNVYLAGGKLELNGTVTGSVQEAGGTVELGEGSIIEGDLLAIGSNVNGIDQADIRGDIQDHWNGTLSLPTQAEEGDQTNSTAKAVWKVIWLPLRSLLWAAAAVAACLLFPRAVSRAGKAIAIQPLTSGLIGLVSLLVGAIALILLAITLIGIPLSLLGVLCLGLIWAFGIISLCAEVGRRLATALKQDWAPGVSAGIGALMLTFVANGIGLIVPCVGWMVPMTAGVIGLGGAFLTRLGTQDYPPHEEG